MNYAQGPESSIRSMRSGGEGTRVATRIGLAQDYERSQNRVATRIGLAQDYERSQNRVLKIMMGAKEEANPTRPGQTQLPPSPHPRSRADAEVRLK